MIRTIEQYIESLRDGRVLYHLGERVKDATTHPVLQRQVWLGAVDWALANDPVFFLSDYPICNSK